MFVVFDLETTGLSTNNCDIIQFAYILFDEHNSFVRAENLYYYYEGMSWSQEAADASHHLSLEFLKQHEDEFKTNLLKMFTVLNRANVCGHNSNSFDCPFVKNWLSRMGLTDFEFGIKQDTMLAMKPITKRPRIKLTKLAELMDIKQSSVEYMAQMWFGSENLRGPHDAAYDVTMTALIALQGIGKGLIKFDSSEPAATVSYDDFSLELESQEDNRSIDPKGIVVALCDNPNDPEGAYYYRINHDKSLYRPVDILPATLNSYISNNEFVDVILYKEADGTYAGQAGGVTYRFIPGDKEQLTVTTPLVTFNDADVDMHIIIKNNFGGSQ